MDELFRGSQRRSEVSWGRDDKSHQGMRHTLLSLCVCVFFLPEKKCSTGIVQRLMAALPGLQFRKYADAIPFEIQHNRVVKNTDSSDAQPFFPFSYSSQAVSIGYIKSPHSLATWRLSLRPFGLSTFNPRLAASPFRATMANQLPSPTVTEGNTLSCHHLGTASPKRRQCPSCASEVKTEPS